MGNFLRLKNLFIIIERLFSDQLTELTARLVGPPGLPGRGRPGRPGQPGLQGATGLKRKFQSSAREYALVQHVVYALSLFSLFEQSTG